VFYRWTRWSIAHRVIAGLASVAASVGVSLLLVWMIWRYPGGPGGWREEGSPPQRLAMIAATLVIASAGDRDVRGGLRLVERARVGRAE